MPKRHSKNVQAANDALTILFEETFYEIMLAMVKAEPHEAEYASFKEEARILTKSQLRRIAKYAAEFYVRETGTSPAEVPQERIRSLKKQAIAYALKRLKHEAQK